MTEAETLRTTIRNARIRHTTAADGIVTASLGVAPDAALYRAKSGGRDRVEGEGT